MSKKIYMGNYPGSANYDDSLPIGFIKWDDVYDGADERDDDWEEEPEKEVPDEEEEINQIKSHE